MVRKIVFSAITGSLSLIFMGCEDNTTGSNKTFHNGGNFSINQPAEETGQVSENKNFVYKSSVQYAELEEVMAAQAECHGNSDQMCVYVCHRPPGNPDNEKTKILPIKALTAHLNHGADHHNSHDYIGPCESDSNDSDPDVVVDDPGDGSSGGSEDGYGVDVPTWCEKFYDHDQDCDGYDDDTFAPTF